MESCTSAQNLHNDRKHAGRFDKETPMRITIFAGAAAALAALTTPVLAKHPDPDAQKSDDKSAPSTCSAYEQAADGSWQQLPCKEAGDRGQAQTQHRSAGSSTDHEER
jgi:hypothetical protein